MSKDKDYDWGDDNGNCEQELPTVKLSIYRLGCILCAIFGFILGWTLRGMLI